jgi:tetratricopeptide (TPR) repeat protein
LRSVCLSNTDFYGSQQKCLEWNGIELRFSTIRNLQLQLHKTLICLIGIGILSTSALAAKTDYTQGVEHYNKGDMADAVTLLKKAIAGSEDTALAHYYLANAQLRLGNHVQAIWEYRLTLARNPSSQIAEYCHKAIQAYGTSDSGSAGTTVGADGGGYVGIALKQNFEILRVFRNSPADKAGLKEGDMVDAINGEALLNLSVADAANRLKGKAGTPVKIAVYRDGSKREFTVVRAVAVADQQAVMGKEPSERKRADPAPALLPKAGSVAAIPAQCQTISAPADELDKQLIVIHRHTPDTDAVYSQVIGALSLVPKVVKKELLNGGIKIVIAPTIAEANPDLLHEKPRGYFHGGGFDNVPGLYMPSKKQIFVGERAQWQNSPPQLNRWVQSTMLHETGHALDACRTYPSASGEFKAAYDQDVVRLSSSQRNSFYYYCQEGDAGPSELFAELFAVTLSSGGIDPRSPSLAQAFPASYQVMRGLLDK